MNHLFLKEIISRLQKAEDPVRNEIQEEELIIEQEVKVLAKFVSEISTFATNKKILGKDSYLIYVFEDSINDTVSNDVYMSEDGYIRYQVYDEATYRGFVPEAKFEGGYVTIRIDKFLKDVPLYKIFNFFTNRPSALKEKEFMISEKNTLRKLFLEKLE